MVGQQLKRNFFLKEAFAEPLKNSCNFINTFDRCGGGQVAWDQNDKSCREEL